MHFLADYGLFLAKIATVTVAILLILGYALSFTERAKRQRSNQLTIKKINDQFDEMADTIRRSIQTKVEKKAQKKQDKERDKARKQQLQPKGATEKPPKRLFVLDFNGDIKASAVTALREEVTAILLTAQPEDRVLCRLESAGGLVNAYGLAASQLRRFKAAKIHLTVAVDRTAASGGYMMACVADALIAAPFAVIGSIGVIAQLPNFHRFLEKKHIDFEQLTAGEYKRTLTVFGKNTSKGRAKMQEDIEDAQVLFKTFISENRPLTEIDKVATGEHWYGTRALALKLIDHIQTSDDYLLAAKEDYDMYTVTYSVKKTRLQRLLYAAQSWATQWVRPEQS